VRGIRAARALAGALVVAVAAGGLVVATAGPAAADETLVVTGHGWGHGRGMGQWGAYGYAVDRGQSSAWILDHFYGGTTAGAVPNDAIHVLLRASTGKETIVALTRGDLTTSIDGARPPAIAADQRRAVRIKAEGPELFRVWDGLGCGGPWYERGTVGAGQVVVNPAVQGSDDLADMLQVCEPAGSRYYRGQMVARWVDTALDAPQQHTLNVVARESYLRGVVPSESPPSWGLAGNGAGAQALQAQAVAARSYEAAGDTRWGGVDTCDDIFCQVYRGRAFRPTGSSSVTNAENPITDDAISQTANIVRVRSNAVARTEFSSSTGGWTAGGTFPAVEDLGDGTSANPHHNWSVTLQVTDVENAFDALAGRDLGRLLGVDVLERSCCGLEGGRVRTARGRFTGGDVNVTGSQVRSMFGLQSDWFSVAPIGPPGDLKSDPAGGYVLRADGSLTPFGAASAVSGPGSLGSVARAVDLAGTSGQLGYVLDGYGGMHPVGGAPPPTAYGLYQPGWDIARDLAVRADGTSGYVLDGFGAVYAFGGAPPVDPALITYYQAADLARRLVLRADGASGYVLTVSGGVHSFNGAPPIGGATLPNGVSAVGLILAAGGGRGYVVGSDGNPYPVGGAEAISTAASSAVAAAGRLDGLSGYVATNSGGPSTLGAARPVAPVAGAASEVRDLALVAEPTGYVLDAWGGLHAFGGAPRAFSAAWYPGQNVMRRAVVRRDGAGYVMDVYGNVTGFGTALAGTPGSPTGGQPKWPGFGIARDLVLLDGAGAGYILDGWGGIHPFGGAPGVRGSSYWQGWDIARRIVLLPDGSGGFVLDGWGGLHPFAIGAGAMPSVPPGGPYWAGWDIAQDVVLTSAGGGFVLDGWGGMHPFGSETGGSSWYGGPNHPALGASAEGGRAWVVYVDHAGGLHSAPGAAPLPTPTAYFLGSSLVRDVAVRPR
jgi:SpoIID/LytB domain protein